MRVSFLSVVKSVFAILAIVALGVGGYVGYSKLPGLLKDLEKMHQAESVVPGQEVIVTIPKGASLSQVGSILQNKGVISSKIVFKLVALIHGGQRAIKAGDYALKTGSDAGKVLDQLISGKTLMISFTVPEGYNIFQVGDLMQQMGIMSRDEFLKTARDPVFLKELGIDGNSLEGFLFPDTYFFRPSEKVDGKLIIRRMVQRFFSVYDNYVRATAEKNGWSVVQVVTLASLIEKEARPHEHALVSAVFHNRLRLHMRLQSDPTVIYGIKPMGSKITREDLNRKQPYNTYQFAGLPPGPIANPGKESLIAAVNPADADYLYFVAKNDGTHQFSCTLKEHNRWVNTYQRQRLQQPAPASLGREARKHSRAHASE
jgi:peptidoglycan lytic transglycosylase G